MENKKHSQQFLRKRKFLLVLPLLVLPFITMIFWSLGGGNGSNVEAQSISKQSGLNLKLPEAKLKNDKGLDKLSFYKQAAIDSQKIFKERKLDPYWNKYTLSNKKSDDPFHLGQTNLKHDDAFPNVESQRPVNADGNIDENEAKVYSKLQQLNAALNKVSSKPQTTKSNGIKDLQSLEQYDKTSKDVQKLERLMHAMKEDAGSDPEMLQLNNMLDKILAIQHSESVNDTTHESAKIASNTLTVAVRDNNADISLISSSSKQTQNDTIPLSDVHQNSFYSLESSKNIVDRENLIKAVMPETQTLISGSTVKLLLGTSITIKGLTVPENTFIYGTASLNNERLRINIASIQYQNNILPVSLDAYDLDGITGIYVPGSINRDVAKQSTDKAVNSVDITSLDPSIAAQATSAGIQAAKTLIGKKVKLVKVTVRAGYQVFLKDNTQNQ